MFLHIKKGSPLCISGITDYCIFKESLYAWSEVDTRGDLARLMDDNAYSAGPSTTKKLMQILQRLLSFSFTAVYHFLNKEA
ncbi:predicted 3-phenylpropionic transporter [Bacillus sp. SG-1]|nr:predicted 3-phenylpropionic transporter [Bacillus sp. SG-1]